MPKTIWERERQKKNILCLVKFACYRWFISHCRIIFSTKQTNQKNGSNWIQTLPYYYVFFIFQFCFVLFFLFSSTKFFFYVPIFVKIIIIIILNCPLGPCQSFGFHLHSVKWSSQWERIMKYIWMKLIQRISPNNNNNNNNDDDNHKREI